MHNSKFSVKFFYITLVLQFVHFMVLKMISIFIVYRLLTRKLSVTAQLLLFDHHYLRHIGNMESIIFLPNRCVFYLIFANWACVNDPKLVFTCFNVNFFHQISTNMPKNATELVKLLKTYKICFFVKMDGFFKKNFNSIKVVQGSKFGLACV